MARRCLLFLDWKPLAPLSSAQREEVNAQNRQRFLFRMNPEFFFLFFFLLALASCARKLQFFDFMLFVSAHSRLKGDNGDHFPVFRRLHLRLFNIKTEFKSQEKDIIGKP